MLDVRRSRFDVPRLMQHRVFSPRRIAAISAQTFTELTRLKAFYALLIFALVLIGSSVFMARMTFQQEFQVLKDISLGAISIFTSLLAVIATARLLPQEIEDRTIYAILARPVPRFEYTAGKLIGILSLLAASIIVMAALFLAVLWLREQSALAETARQMSGAPQEQIEEARRAVRASASGVNLLPAIVVIYCKACVLASLTLFISTFATSNIFTIVVTAFVYFIGHLQAIAREMWLQEQGGAWLSRAFLALVALLFPDLQLFDLADEVVAGKAIGSMLFLKICGLGCFYTVIYWLLATAVFNGKEL